MIFSSNEPLGSPDLLFADAGELGERARKLINFVNVSIFSETLTRFPLPVD